MGGRRGVGRGGGMGGRVVAWKTLLVGISFSAPKLGGWTIEILS